MLMIRLQRVGRKHEPVFRLVLTDSKNGPKSGKFLEILGHFDPRKEKEAKFETERVKYWLSVGAKLSGTVHNLLIERKIIEGKKKNVLPRKFPIKKEEKVEESKEGNIKDSKTEKAKIEEEKPVEKTPKEEDEKGVVEEN
ncbi:MAG: 30S ribosomal protein S16 [Candidatus Zambryskibacteria bacterium]|nr:30S ribosomal protein S16 [Candidatus Zambryskibacteria bacterium]